MLKLCLFLKLKLKLFYSKTDIYSPILIKAASVSAFNNKETFKNKITYFLNKKNLIPSILEIKSRQENYETLIGNSVHAFATGGVTCCISSSR